jgi:hypothetical protein
MRFTSVRHPEYGTGDELTLQVTKVYGELTLQVKGEGRAVMNVVLWIVAGILAVAMLGAGSMKLVTPKEGLAAKGMTLDDLPAAAIKGIGTLEVLGGIGLVVPALVNIAPVLVPIAAVGVAIVMAGAVVFHLRRKELKDSVPALVLLILALVVVWGRFGAWAF